jgi:hypothetical protein
MITQKSKSEKPVKSAATLVEMIGFEPTASAVQVRRSPN